MNLKPDTDTVVKLEPQRVYHQHSLLFLPQWSVQCVGEISDLGLLLVAAIPAHSDYRIHRTLHLLIIKQVLSPSLIHMVTVGSNPRSLILQMKVKTH